MNATYTFVSFNQNSITEIEFILPKANHLQKRHQKAMKCTSDSLLHAREVMVAQTVSKRHKKPPLARGYMRERWRWRCCKNHLRCSLLQVRDVVVAQTAACGVREREAHVLTCFQCW